MGCNIANVGASERVPETGATSRPSLAIDSCDEYAIRGEQTSQVRSSSRHTFNANRTYTFTFSPTAVLAARRKIVCPTCTVNPEQPVMIEEQTEWVVHQKTRLHRRLASKSDREEKVKEMRTMAGKERGDEQSSLFDVNLEETRGLFDLR